MLKKRICPSEMSSLYPYPTKSQALSLLACGKPSWGYAGVFSLWYIYATSCWVFRICSAVILLFLIAIILPSSGYCGLQWASVVNDLTIAFQFLKNAPFRCYLHFLGSCVDRWQQQQTQANATSGTRLEIFGSRSCGWSNEQGTHSCRKTQLTAQVSTYSTSTWRLGYSDEFKQARLMQLDYVSVHTDVEGSYKKRFRAANPNSDQRNNE